MSSEECCVVIQVSDMVLLPMLTLNFSNTTVSISPSLLYTAAPQHLHPSLQARNSIWLLLHPTARDHKRSDWWNHVGYITLLSILSFMCTCQQHSSLSDKTETFPLVAFCFACLIPGLNYWGCVHKQNEKNWCVTSLDEGKFMARCCFTYEVWIGL